jgi:hypothetical protein
VVENGLSTKLRNVPIQTHQKRELNDIAILKRAINTAVLKVVLLAIYSCSVLGNTGLGRIVHQSHDMRNLHIVGYTDARTTTYSSWDVSCIPAGPPVTGRPKRCRCPASEGGSVWCMFLDSTHVHRRGFRDGELVVENTEDVFNFSATSLFRSYITSISSLTGTGGPMVR